MKKSLLLATLACVSVTGGIFAQDVAAQSATRDQQAQAVSRYLPATREGYRPGVNRLTVLSSRGPEAVRSAQCASQAKRMMDKLAEADPEAARHLFSPSAQKLVTAEHLGEMWASLRASYGVSVNDGSYMPIDNAKEGASAVALPLNTNGVSLTANALCNSKYELTDFKVVRSRDVASR